VLYPVFLPDRLVVFLYHQGVIGFSEIPDIESIKTAIKNLSASLSNALTSLQDIHKPSQFLYQKLIYPFEKQLSNVQTLIIVSDGDLRTVPFTVFYNKQKQQYLLENYAIVVVPSLSLTDQQKRRSLKNFFLAGLSEQVANFPNLPNVEIELDALQALAVNKRVLQNQTFTLNNFRQNTSAYPASAVHIATHGAFENRIEDSFLLAHNNERLKLQELETLSKHNVVRGEPVELLSLSACETAKGDERAALGLSGVAVKAGAKTALASLWKVNDASTCYLMERFYTLLQQPMSAVQALRTAQLELLNHQMQPSACLTHASTYQLPYYWAAFILIGNWN